MQPSNVLRLMHFASVLSHTCDEVAARMQSSDEHEDAHAQDVLRAGGAMSRVGQLTEAEAAAVSRAERLSARRAAGKASLQLSSGPEVDLPEDAELMPAGAGPARMAEKSVKVCKRPAARQPAPACQPASVKLSVGPPAAGLTKEKSAGLVCKRPAAKQQAAEHRKPRLEPTQQPEVVCKRPARQL